MNMYLPPSLGFEPRHLVFSTWNDHMPFGYDLVSAMQPKTIVELGSYGGLSFFTFCQALQEQKIDAMAYAIDTWQGDASMGDYGEEVFVSVDQHARDYYRGISYLMRMTFNEALPQFVNESIDLLHIDGLHTYEAVCEDFENWYPKVKPGGIILFHDISAKIDGFGVEKKWKQLEAKHETFAFRHGFGLGVLRKTGGPVVPKGLLSILFEGNEQSHSDVRALYSYISRSQEALRQQRKARQRKNS